MLLVFQIISGRTVSSLVLQLPQTARETQLDGTYATTALPPTYPPPRNLECTGYPRSGSTYNLVPGSTTNFMTSQSVSGYMCSYVELPQNNQFTVLPGDLLAACVATTKFFGGAGRLGVVGVVTGLSILEASSTCNTLGNSVDTSQSANNGYTIHINLGRLQSCILLLSHLGIDLSS